jgi:hypothetical protein
VEHRWLIVNAHRHRAIPSDLEILSGMRDYDRYL